MHTFRGHVWSFFLCWYFHPFAWFNFWIIRVVKFWAGPQKEATTGCLIRTGAEGLRPQDPEITEVTMKILNLRLWHFLSTSEQVWAHSENIWQHMSTSENVWERLRMSEHVWERRNTSQHVCYHWWLNGYFYVSICMYMFADLSTYQMYLLSTYLSI